MEWPGQALRHAKLGLDALEEELGKILSWHYNRKSLLRDVIFVIPREIGARFFLEHVASPWLLYEVFQTPPGINRF
jgi:hypothetical protein